MQLFFFALLTKKKGFVIIPHALDADIAQSVEHVIGNDEVMGPNPIISSKRHSERSAFSVFRGNYLLCCASCDNSLAGGAPADGETGRVRGGESGIRDSRGTGIPERDEKTPAQMLRQNTPQSDKSPER